MGDRPILKTITATLISWTRVPIGPKNPDDSPATQHEDITKGANASEEPDIRANSWTRGSIGCT